MTAGGCTATLPDGRRCHATLQRDADVCVFHSPEHADEVAEARRRGGLHRRREQALANEHEFRGLRDPEAICHFIELAAYDALGLEPSVTRVRLIVAISEAAMRLLPHVEFEGRLAALEADRKAKEQGQSADRDGNPTESAT